MLVQNRGTDPDQHQTTDDLRTLSRFWPTADMIYDRTRDAAARLSPTTSRSARSYAPVMSDRTTPWFPTNIRPVRSGWYQLDSADLLHFDAHSKTWGIWFPQQPGVRHVIDVGPHLRWRGLSAPP